jgi:hypothetical protein
LPLYKYDTSLLEISVFEQRAPKMDGHNEATDDKFETTSANGNLINQSDPQQVVTKQGEFSISDMAELIDVSLFLDRPVTMQPESTIDPDFWKNLVACQYEEPCISTGSSGDVLDEMERPQKNDNEGMGSLPSNGDEPTEMTFDVPVKELIGKQPEVMVDNYKALSAPKIVECLNSGSTRCFDRMPHLMFVKGKEDGALAAVACNPKEARVLLETYLENSVMKRLSDDQAGRRVQVAGRPTKLAKPKQSDAQYVSVVCDMTALDHVPEPFDISVKARSKPHKQRKGRHAPVSPRTKVPIPANKTDSYAYEIQMAVSIPTWLGGKDVDESVKLISRKSDEVVQVRLFPYVMSVSFGSMQDTVTIADVDDQLRKFIREECQLPTALGLTDCKVSFPSKNFARTVSFDLGTWKRVEAYEPLVTRTSLNMPPATTVTKRKVGVRRNVDHDVRAEDSLAGGVAKFVSACYPGLFSGVAESMQVAFEPNRKESIVTNLKLPERPTRTTDKKIKTVEESLSSLDHRSKAYVEELEKKTLVYENIRDEYKSIIQAKDETLQQAVAFGHQQNDLIVELRREMAQLQSKNVALKKELRGEHYDEGKGSRLPSANDDDQRAPTPANELDEKQIIETLKIQKEELERENASLRQKLDRLEVSLMSINERLEGFEKANEQLKSLFASNKRKCDENDSIGIAKRAKQDERCAVTVQT